MNRRTLTTKRRPPAKERPDGGKQVPASAASSARTDEDARRLLIAVEAYFLAERRGFMPGCELDDWLAAETIVEARLRGTPTKDSSENEGRRRPGARRDIGTHQSSSSRAAPL